MKILKFALIGLILFGFGCSTIHDTRIVGSFVSDKDATMAYLQGTGMFTERQLGIFSGMLGKWKMECDGVTVVSTFDDYKHTEPLNILKRTNDYILVETHSLGEPVESKIIFTEDGYWEVSEAEGPYFRVKFLRIGQPPVETEKK